MTEMGRCPWPSNLCLQTAAERDSNLEAILVLLSPPTTNFHLTSLTVGPDLMLFSTFTTETVGGGAGEYSRLSP